MLEIEIEIIIEQGRIFQCTMFHYMLKKLLKPKPNGTNSNHDLKHSGTPLLQCLIGFWPEISSLSGLVEENITAPLSRYYILTCHNEKSKRHSVSNVMSAFFVGETALSRLALGRFYSARNARIASVVLATAIPSVRLSVCLSVRHTPVLCQNDGT